MVKLKNISSKKTEEYFLKINNTCYQQVTIFLCVKYLKVFIHKIKIANVTYNIRLQFFYLNISYIKM